MNQIEKQLDNIIIRLKSAESLESIKFLREYGNHRMENPVRSVMAVVSVKFTERSMDYIGGYLSPALKGELYTAKAEIKVYAPAHSNGSGLTEIVSALLTELRKADEENIITEMSAGSIVFDADMNAVYRAISLSLEFCLYEEA